ncbi:MAG TPA: IPT/TIG domain-containing protein [Chitinophagaceae bacterium]|nr:IPT/TIG domain-containing protein [Chitinophagaceae bacterium]
MSQQRKMSFMTGTLLWMAVLLIGFTSCKKDDVEDTNPPVISGVTNLNNRSSMLASADFDQWIIIKGEHLATTHQVEFNGVLTPDSLFYGNDTSVTVKIPKTLPDPINNPITVTTKYGTATYNFQILQPPPVVTGFDPVAGEEGTEVNILGDFFNGVTSVRFNDTEAEILSSGMSQIKVKVPVGQTFGYIHVTTPVGSATSAKVFGFQTLIFGDGIADGFSNTSYSAVVDFANTENVKRGTSAIKVGYTGWGAVRLTKAVPIDLSGYTAVKFSVYSAPDNAAGTTRRVKLALSGNFGAGFTVTLVRGEWNDFQIPLTSLGNPATLTNIIIQEFSGLQQNIYIDDVGLI